MQLWRLKEAELLCFSMSSHRGQEHLCERESPAVQPPAAEHTSTKVLVFLFTLLILRLSTIKHLL